MLHRNQCKETFGTSYKSRMLQTMIT
uniref:Uncharacterized protein n=1 Tax=Arundo donax TaxID=35708 RepID=A0A0A9H930_ARUDO